MERGEVERVGALDVRDEQGARSVVLLQVDREPEVHVLVPHDDGLPSTTPNDEFMFGTARQRLQHRVADEVRERDLAAPRAGEVVVQDLAVDLEQLGGNGAHRRGGRDAEARLHVLDDACRGAAQRLRRVAVEHDRARPAPACRRGVPARARVPSAAAARCGGGGGRGRRLRARHVVLEELAPAGRDRLRVVLVEPVHLVDQARVRARDPGCAVGAGTRRLPQRYELGQVECQVERLASVESGIAHGLVPSCEVFASDRLGTTETLGDVVTGELDVHTARPDVFGATALEERLDFGDHGVEVPCLVTAFVHERVAVHRVARPDDGMAGPRDRAQQRGQALARPAARPCGRRA